MRKTILLVAFFLASNTYAGGVGLTVEKGSSLERKLNYSLVVIDHHSYWRSKGYEELYPESKSEFFVVELKSQIGGKLKDLYKISLSIKKNNGHILDVPLQIRSNYEKDNNVIDIFFQLDKELLNNANLNFETGNRLSPVIFYIKLNQYL